MSGTTESLRRRITGAGDLQSVVRSMKALAASSIGQYEKAVSALDDYTRSVELGLSVCLREHGPQATGAESTSREAPAIGAILFGSDQGLVGRFNEVLAEFALHALAALPGNRRKIWAVGERIHALVTDAGHEAALLPVPTSVHHITPLVGRMLIGIEAAQGRGDAGEVHLFHNHPGAGAVYGPIAQRLLPLDPDWRHRLLGLPWPARVLPEVIGGVAPALSHFVRSYLFVRLFQACAESLASENASRLASMQRAEKNIEDILETLNRRLHSLRQESIDEELFDVIAGFEALSKDAA